MIDSTKPKKPTDPQKSSDISKSTSDGSSWDPDPDLKDKIYEYQRLNMNESIDIVDILKKIKNSKK